MLILECVIYIVCLLKGMYIIRVFIIWEVYQSGVYYRGVLYRVFIIGGGCYRRSVSKGALLY